MLPHETIAAMLGPLVAYVLIWLLLRVSQHPLSPARAASEFRNIGWDLTSVSVGFLVLAFLTTKSRLGEFLRERGTFQNGATLLAVVFFVMLYWAAVDIRFRVLERVRDCPARRFAWGACGWALGLGLLGLCAYLGTSV